jgi:hypothetical protein
MVRMRKCRRKKIRGDTGERGVKKTNRKKIRGDTGERGVKNDEQDREEN